MKRYGEKRKDYFLWNISCGRWIIYCVVNKKVLLCHQNGEKIYKNFTFIYSRTLQKALSAVWKSLSQCVCILLFVIIKKNNINNITYMDLTGNIILLWQFQIWPQKDSRGGKRNGTGGYGGWTRTCTGIKSAASASIKNKCHNWISHFFMSTKRPELPPNLWLPLRVFVTLPVTAVFAEC